ncbi:MAG TPA: hypothetical protein VLE73_06070 [Candidatus Saccharimonadales bacterium]|nr:hypothetical protein [Candidatus Saccharimonadales bacterium]
MKSKQQSGSVLVSILAVMIFLTTLLFGIVSLASANLSRARGRIQLLQAQYAAESGADAAIAVLNGGNDSYTGTTSDVTLLDTTQYKATYSTTVANGSTSKERVVTAVGKVYAPAAASTPRYTRTIRVTAQRTSTTTASSMVSRNIVDIASGVKDIKAKDVYVNGFINMNKNTTNLIAENITVAGKNTSASNCSIGGTGNLVKPTSFSTPGQTKTKLLLAYNNCISPPGNTSNSNFDVSANQGTIGTVQSMYIPWSQFMDNTYTDANNCNDWTTGASPRTIPSISKRSHYPDSSSNVASTCGTSGSLALGSNQYNITDNVHVRANLCSAAACTPTFYNPSTSLRYIFVEGTVNFDEVDTASGSGPIALIVYGTDPSSKASACPYGGSIYLGNSGTTAAPALYFLAMNGLCIDKTKFGSSPALGGVAGKNLYIASNSGTPFDLAMDTAFPVSQIPIDLAWRAARYERL